MKNSNKVTLTNDMTYAQKIEYYANSSNLISINNGNRKTGIGCLTMSFPQCSCLENAPCRKGCYCSKGCQQFPSVQGAYYRNWRIWNSNPEDFEKQLNFFLDMAGLPLFRYCDCGDIPDAAFLAMMFRVALNHPNISFLAYTKKYDMVNEFLSKGNVIPDNLTIRFSYWDKCWEVPNPYNLPAAYVEFTDEHLTPEIPKNAFHCHGGKQTTCSICRVCFNKKISAVKFTQH